MNEKNYSQFWEDLQLGKLAKVHYRVHPSGKDQLQVYPIDPSDLAYRVELSIPLSGVLAKACLRKGTGFQIIHRSWAKNLLSYLGGRWTFGFWKGFMLALIMASSLHFLYVSIGRSIDESLPGASTELNGASKNSGAFPNFEDVVLPEATRKELAEVLELLEPDHRSRLVRLGGTLPKGLLFSGPPGTGKTETARAFAKTIGAQFFAYSGSDLADTMYCGSGAKKIREAFDAIRTCKGICVLFIDELDALAVPREYSRTGSDAQAVDQLLYEMDGFNSTEGVLIIGATNRPEAIDSAVRRPGRFDRSIEFYLPSADERLRILKVHIEKRSVPLAEDVDLKRLSRRTAGASGADLANWINEAALCASRRGGLRVNMADFDEAWWRISLGVRKPYEASDDYQRLNSYHEAGHFLARYLLSPIPKAPQSPDWVHLSIISGQLEAGGFAAICAFNPGSEQEITQRQEDLMPPENLLKNISFCLGGKIGEELFRAEAGEGAPVMTTYGVSSDFSKALGLAGRYLTQSHSKALRTFCPELGLLHDAELTHYYSPEFIRTTLNLKKQLLDEVEEATRALLLTNRELHRKLSNRLYEKETLNQEDLESFFTENSSLIKRPTSFLADGVLKGSSK